MILARIKANVLIMPNGCWLWLGAIDHKGYGRIKVRGRSARVHIEAYKAVIGPVPEGHVLDHVRCQTRHCASPYCLEPVTNRVNTLRGRSPAAERARRIHCPRGHALVEGNVYERPDRPGTRECLICKRERRRTVAA